MKHVMKSLSHNGIYVPRYDYKGFTINIQGNTIKLTPKSEQMAVAWIRKNLSTVSPPDNVFKKNFMKEFLAQVKIENPSASYLDCFCKNYLSAIDNGPVMLNNSTMPIVEEIDFSQIVNFVEQEKAAKLALTKEVKKQQAEERKAARLKLKEHYGVAEVDGQKLEIANWTAEPSCLFAGRGDHPQRGKWKEGPSKSDITLNISTMTDEEAKKQGWAGAVWQKKKMYVASWKDKLTGKIKYVWFSDTAFLKQNREKEKFQKAETLDKQIKQIEAHILKNLDSKELERRKVATVSWLILVPNMRVGDEKDPDEADTVGAITLRSEHITINGDTLHFDFLGKDSVRWVKDYKAPPAVIENIKKFKAAQEADPNMEYLFQGIDSKKVSRFLSEKMPKLTAKVFRTWRCTKTVKEELEKSGVTKKDPDYKKSFAAKLANYKVAEVANHKRKIPPTFDERLAKKEANLKALEAQLIAKKAEGKKTESLQTRIEKAKLDIELTKLTREYNLGTSLKSYIDPTAYVKWAKKVKFDIVKFYPTTLRNKFSWALQTDKAEAEQCECTPA
jgi:DNA topoisomerase-1